MSLQGTLYRCAVRMARNKAYDYRQMQMVAVSLEQQLVPGTLEYAIHDLIEDRIDVSGFDARFRNDDTGRTAYDPRILLKIVLLSYARGTMSSRKMERACRENITFMALACGQTPDHSTLAEFVSAMGEAEVTSLFTQILMVCEEEGLLGGTHFSLDGVKLSSNASKEWSGTHADLTKKKRKLEEKVEEAIREHRAADQQGGDRDGRRLEERVKRLRRNADRIDRYLKESEPKRGRRGTEIQGNITDPESAKMVSSHGVVQGYNANAMVDSKHQVIVAGRAMGEGDDGMNAGPMLEEAGRNLAVATGEEEPLKGKIVSADTSYFSVENLQSCSEHDVNAHIPDREFRKRDPRFAEARRHRRSVDKHKKRYASKKRWFLPEDFRFDDATGRLICPAGKALYRNGRNFMTKDGYLATSYRAPKSACRDCPLRSKCLRNPQSESRQVRLFHGRRPGSLTDAMKQKIDTPDGRAIYSQRLGIVEPVFGNLRAQKGLDRFTLRGQAKVNTQWLLYCMVHNIEKIGKYGFGGN